MFLGSKPSSKWTDSDYDEASFKLTQIGRRLTDLFKLAAEERRFAESIDGDFDVYLLKSLKKGDDFIDEIVTVDKVRNEHAKSLKNSLQSILRKSGDQELQLIALAQIIDEFLKSKREQERKTSADQKDLLIKEKGNRA